MAARLLPRLSVRARSAVAAALAVALVLGVGIAGFAWVLRWNADDHVRSVATTTAEVMADRVAVDGTAVVTEYDGDALVQVVDAAGRVAAAGRGAARLVLPVGGGPAELGERRYYVVERPVADSDLRVRVALEYDDDPATRRTALALLVAVAPALVVLIAVLAWSSTSRALRPVARVRAEVDAIGADALDRRVAVPDTRDEIADLVVTTNRLLDRIEAGAETQRRFVADASHELRSPLATLRQYAELAQAHPDQISTAELAEVAATAALRLQGLVDDLLVLATLTDRPPGALIEVDLDDVVRRELATSGSVGLELDTAGVRPVKVRGDEHRLAMVVRNLVANAMRFATARVRVATGTDPAGAWLVVADDGPGVPPAERERVFDRFVRLDASRARDAGGSGLGLAIVAGVVAEHGGTVVVDDAPGGGARFTVRLPTWDA